MAVAVASVVAAAAAILTITSMSIRSHVISISIASPKRLPYRIIVQTAMPVLVVVLVGA
jgi:hypothetical protein